MQRLGFIVFCLLHILLLPVFSCFISYFFIIFYNDLFFIWLISLYIIKIVFLPILYKIFKNIYTVSILSNKLKSNKTAFVTLFLTFIADILFIVNICKYTNIALQEYIKTILLTWLICGGGLSLSYLSMILWLKVKKYNISAVVAAVSAIISLIQLGYFIYIKGLSFSGLLLFLPAIFIFVINYPFQKEENSSAFSKNLIGILNFIVLILVQTVSLSVILLALN